MKLKKNLNQEIMMQNNTFSLLSAVFSALSSLYRDTFGLRDKKYGS